jgi:glutamyl/glutaminyl-tRNA synthetase
MRITHVVRGDDWIPSAPFHVQLYKAMGWPEPVWIHLPLILNKRGEKLKKRDPEGGYLISDFQTAGYLPQALFNYLLLLGWSPDGEEELIDKHELRQQFRLERLSASPAIFDWDKLNWVNRRYLQRLSDGELAGLLKPVMEDSYGPLWGNEAWLETLTGTIRDDLVRLADAVELAEWALSENVEQDAEAREALTSAEARPVLTELVAELAQIVLLDTLTADSILRGMRARWKQRAGWGPRQVYTPIRAALIGAVHGPPVAQIMALLGKERCLERIGAAMAEHL